MDVHQLSDQHRHDMFRDIDMFIEIFRDDHQKLPTAQYIMDSIGYDVDPQMVTTILHLAR